MKNVDNECSRCFHYAMGELPTSEAKTFEKHLMKCEECRASYAEFMDIRAAVEQAPASDTQALSVWTSRRMQRFSAVAVATVILAASLIMIPERGAVTSRMEDAVHDLHSRISAIHYLHLGPARFRI